MEFNHDSSFSSGEYGLNNKQQQAQQSQAAGGGEQDAEQLKMDKDRIYKWVVFVDSFTSDESETRQIKSS